LQAAVVYHTDKQLNAHANYNIIEFIHKCEGKYKFVHTELVI
jgi:hypothetical protein